MTISNDFSFSQGSLQDYSDCRRRFQLRYLQHLAWPAVESQPALEAEHHMKQGQAFHRLVQQHLTGLPPEKLAAMIHDDDLETWWQNYLAFAQDPRGLGEFLQSDGLRFPEVGLSAPLASSRLTAKYDLVCAQPGGRMVIFDWKTYRKQPRHDWLAGHLQTRVYPYLLVKAGAQLNGGHPVDPEQVEMVYWRAGFPTALERFPYSPAQYQKHEAYLSGLVEEIAALPEESFYLTEKIDRCRFCVYRSLCERDVEPGDFGDLLFDTQAANQGGPMIDFEQISEIEF